MSEQIKNYPILIRDNEKNIFFVSVNMGEHDCDKTLWSILN